MERKDQISQYLKKLMGEGDVSSSGLITPSRNIETNALRARDLAEEALADQILKNTGTPIPDKGASRSQIEKFLQDISKEHYPELGDVDLELKKGLSSSHGAEGIYSPETGKISLDRDMVAKDPRKAVAGLMHENAHNYDNKILGITDGMEIDSPAFAKARGDIRNLSDPTDIYEAVAKKARHHAEIPKLREGSFGLGALKSLMRSGTFKGAAPLLAKGAAAGATGLMSLASEAADAETLNDGTEEESFIRDMQEKNRRMKTLQQYPEAQKMYDEMDSGKAFDFRRDALNKLVTK